MTACTPEARPEVAEYLVTGFPYFRGRKVVEYLLRAEPDARIHVVVPPEQTDQLRRAMARLALAARERVSVLDGDVSYLDLGLSGPEYLELAGRITRIYHAAQVTHLDVDRRIARSVNVGATREVIELAKVCERLESVVVFSSASVSGNRTGIVLERELQAGQSFRSPVEETLALAEKMARSAMADLPLTVVRPTQIIGDSSTGEVERFDGLYLLILLIVSSPQEVLLLLPTRGDVPLHVVPIDYVVKAAHHVAGCEQARGRTLHLVDPNPLRVKRVFEIVAERGGRALPEGRIPANLLRSLFGTTGVNLVSKAPRVLLDLIATHVHYDAHDAEQVLANSGIECPSFESYIDQVVDYVRAQIEQRGDQSSAQESPDGPSPADETSDS